MANTLIYVGIGLIIAGIAYKYGLLGWFGNLPGDIRYQTQNTSVFIPITSVLIVSVVVSLLLRLFGR